MHALIRPEAVAWTHLAQGELLCNDLVIFAPDYGASLEKKDGIPAMAAPALCPTAP